MFERFLFWIQKKKYCKCCCVTCKHYKECKNDLLYAKQYLEMRKLKISEGRRVYVQIIRRVIHITIQNHGMVFKGNVLDSTYSAGDYI